MKKKTIQDVLGEGWNYELAEQFIHCKNCLDKFLGSEEHEEQSPRDYMNYEVSSYPFKYSNGHTEGIIVVWCKRCKLMVWNSSFLKQRKKNEF